MRNLKVKLPILLRMTVLITLLLGGVEVKGKSEPLSLYTVHGYKHANGTVEIVEIEYSSYKAEGADKVKMAS